MSTIPAGGYDAGANDRPGMSTGTDETTGVRHTGFLDAGTCSKAVRALPAMSKYFKSLRNVLTGLQGQTKSNTSAVSSLLQGQADINNETNLLNYWMRQMSPQMDKLNVELRQGNDALSGMTFGASSSDAPGVPDAITLLPGPTTTSLILYFVKPSYGGMTAISGYQVAVFDSAADAKIHANATTLSLTPEQVDPLGDFADKDKDDMAAMYGSDLCLVYSDDAASLDAMILNIRAALTASSAAGKCVRLRAKNTSGDAAGADLWGPWSSPTMMVQCADGPALKPVIQDVILGAQHTLISWRAPMAKQADNSYAMVGGIHSYDIESTGGDPAVTSFHIVNGGSSTAAQIPLSAGAQSIAVQAKSGALIAESTLRSEEMAIIVPDKVNVPTVSMSTLTYVDNVPVVRFTMSVPDYYSATAIKYTITKTSATDTGPLIHRSSSPSALDPVTPTTYVAQLKYGLTYTFRTTAEHDEQLPKQSNPSTVLTVKVPAIGPTPLSPFTTLVSDTATASGANYTLNYSSPSGVAAFNPDPAYTTTFTDIIVNTPGDYTVTLTIPTTHIPAEADSLTLRVGGVDTIDPTSAEDAFNTIFTWKLINLAAGSGSAISLANASNAPQIIMTKAIFQAIRADFGSLSASIKETATAAGVKFNWSPAALPKQANPAYADPFTNFVANTTGKYQIVLKTATGATGEAAAFLATLDLMMDSTVVATAPVSATVDSDTTFTWTLTSVQAGKTLSLRNKTDATATFTPPASTLVFSYVA